jgi:hypothetical protein
MGTSRLSLGEHFVKIVSICRAARSSSGSKTSALSAPGVHQGIGSAGSEVSCNPSLSDNLR